MKRASVPSSFLPSEPFSLSKIAPFNNVRVLTHKLTSLNIQGYSFSESPFLGKAEAV